MREGRLLAENSPEGLHQIWLHPPAIHLKPCPWFKVSPSDLTPSIHQQFSINCGFIFLSPWSPALLQEHSTSSLEGVFLQLCQVLIYISFHHLHGEDLNSQFLQIEFCLISPSSSSSSSSSGRSTMLWCGKQRCGLSDFRWEGGKIIHIDQAKTPHCWIWLLRAG